jgi:hypothetical protein
MNRALYRPIRVRFKEFRHELPVLFQMHREIGMRILDHQVFLCFEMLDHVRFKVFEQARTPRFSLTLVDRQGDPVDSSKKVSCAVCRWCRSRFYTAQTGSQCPWMRPPSSGYTNASGRCQCVEGCVVGSIPLNFISVAIDQECGDYGGLFLEEI